MDLYKKLKPNLKSGHGLSVTDLINELSKYKDRKIDISVKQTVDKLVEEAKSCLSNGEEVDASTIKRMKEILEQMQKQPSVVSMNYSPIVLKRSNWIVENSGIESQSPILKRKPYQVNQVSLNEMEEKLKSIRQKRLTRLSTFVDEQSKLSEYRRSAGNATEEVSHDPKEEDRSKSVKNSKKFINKISCAAPDSDLMVENDFYFKPSRKSLESNIQKMDNIHEEVNNSNFRPKLGEKLQRKGIYFNEKQRAFVDDKIQEEKIKEESPSDSKVQKNILESFAHGIVTDKTEIIASSNLKKTKSDFKTNWSKLKALMSDESQPQKLDNLPKLRKNAEQIQVYRKSGRVNTPRSPMPLPRRLNNTEMVLRKLQRNWNSLNDILKNESEVDYDELEDMKRSHLEVNNLLQEYLNNVKKLEYQIMGDLEKITKIKEEINLINEDIQKFRGLRRDDEYQKMSEKLFDCRVQVDKIDCNSSKMIAEKLAVSDAVRSSLKKLEEKVKRNEGMLIDLFKEQVYVLGTNNFNITPT